MTDEILNGVAQTELRQRVERLEQLENEKAGISGEISEIFAALKSSGFDVPRIKAVMKKRRLDAARRQEADALEDLYERAIGGGS